MSVVGRSLAGVVVGLLVATAARAGVTAQARIEPPRVGVGDPAELTVDVRGTQDSSVPAVPAPGGVAVRYVGPATRISIVNGQTTSSITHYFTVTAQRPGPVTLGPITVTADGATIQAGTLTLQVGGGPVARAQPEEAVRLELAAPRTRVYLRERVPFTLTLLVGAAQVGDVQFPQVAGDGIAVDPLGPPEQRRETRDGVSYQVVEFQGAVVPLRTGAITVGPATMRMTVLAGQGRRRGGFFQGGMPESITLESAPLGLEVLALPEAGRPPEFSGAVGQFSLDVRATPLDVTAGDPVTLTYTLGGEGDLSAIAPPAVSGSEALRVYPVQPAAAAPKGAAGTRIFEQVVIPQHPGTLALPPVRFSWFDPQVEGYRTDTGAPITLTVRPSAAGGASQIVGAPVGEGARPPETLGRDIVFIKETPGRLEAARVPRWRRPAFWALQLVPLFALVVAAWFERRRRRFGSDTRLVRATGAGRAARAAFARARRALDGGDRAGCDDAVAGALTGYLAAKLDLPPGGVTADEVARRLRAAHVPEALADELRDVLAACERSRFAPGSPTGDDPRRLLAQAEALVRSLERTRSLARLAGAAAVAIAFVAAGARAADVETPPAAFLRAGALYAGGRYADAAAAYERLHATGVASANTWFNLGNAYLKDGRVGPAVLSYERAARLAPGDPDIRANLAFAREQAGVDAPAAGWGRLVAPLAGGWSGDGLLLGSAVAWWLLAGCLIAARLVPAVRRPATWAAATAAGVLALGATAAAYRIAVTDLRQTAVVIAPAAVAVRFEPSSGGTVHFEAKPGATLQVLAERPGWVQVGRDDGLRGWVERDAVGDVTVPAACPGGPGCDAG